MKRSDSFLDIQEAEYVAGYRIRLTFSDGTTQVVDFEPFLRRARNPDITRYRSIRRFRQFRLHYGDLMWGDYEMLFPISQLHGGRVHPPL